MFHLRSATTWIAAMILALLPIAVAADFGGVFRWTHYVAGLAALLAVVLAASALTSSSDPCTPRQQLLLIPLIIWLGFACFQTISLPGGIVRYLSPASAEAYTDWINPFLSRSDQLSSFPISLAKHDSLHVCAVLGVLIGIAWASAALFHDRKKIVFLLGALSAGATLHAGIGIWRMVFPETEVWSFANDTVSTAFGAFVNRNNAALMLNFGLACSLGLLAWRLTALRGLEVGEPTFALNDLLSLTRDRDSFLGLIGAVLCIAGLLVCGSRGGLVAACFGLLLALGWIRQRRGLISIPVVGTFIALSVALLLLPLKLDLESIRRFDFISQQDSSTILRDGRLMHWRDGLDTARSHLPMGSGFSTYAYAYLPHQQSSPNAWFHHADNLWLELLTEQGVVGIALALSIIVITTVALRGLSESPDPIDHGLRITGWYCLGAIVVSQLFDFGLIVLGNLLVVAVLLPAIVSRASRLTVAPTSGNRLESGGRKLFPTWRQRTLVTGVALVSFVLACVSLPRLAQDAKIESLTNSVEANALRLDPSLLAELSQQLESAAGADPSPSALETLAKLEYRKARQNEVLASNPTDVEQVEQRFRDTGPAIKRMLWLQGAADISNSAAKTSQQAKVDLAQSDEATREYVRPFKLSKQILRQLPLSPSARSTILYLDFVDHDPHVTLAALTQLQRLYRNNPPTLVKLGRFAADSGHLELTAELCRSALEQEPSLTVTVLALIDQYQSPSRRESWALGPEASADGLHGKAFVSARCEGASAASTLTALQVLPQNPIHLRLAAPYLLRSVEANRETLRIAFNGLHCEQCETIAARSQCEERHGDVAYALGQFEDAYADYRTASNFDPTNTSLRIKLITRLKDQGRRREALIEARRARAALPDDERFTTMIESMARAD